MSNHFKDTGRVKKRCTIRGITARDAWLNKHETTYKSGTRWVRYKTQHVMGQGWQELLWDKRTRTGVLETIDYVMAGR